MTPPAPAGGPERLGPWELGRVHRAEALRALEQLPDDCVDALITDPPYSSGGFTRSDRAADPSSKYIRDGFREYKSFSGDGRDARSWVRWVSMWIHEGMRVVREGGFFLVFTDWRQLPSLTDALQAGGAIWRGVIAWDKGRGARAPHKGFFKHQCEYVVWGTRGTSRAANWGGPWNGSFTVPVIASEKRHMTAKPVRLLRELVQCAPPGGIVLDPFAGSGTTGIACAREGRRFLGFELSSHYAAVATASLEGEASGLSPEEHQAGQTSILDLCGED